MAPPINPSRDVDLRNSNSHQTRIFDVEARASLVGEAGAGWYPGDWGPGASLWSHSTRDTQPWNHITRNIGPARANTKPSKTGLQALRLALPVVNRKADPEVGKRQGGRRIPRWPSGPIGWSFKPPAAASVWYPPLLLRLVQEDGEDVSGRSGPPGHLGPQLGDGKPVVGEGHLN